MESPYPQLIKNVTTRQRVDVARNIVTTELHDIHQCYYEKLPYEEFLRTKVYPGSKDLLILESRCIYRGIIETLITRELVAVLKDHLGDVAFFGRASTQFVRVAFPNMTSNGDKKFDNVVNTPLHYDNYHNVDTRTTWIPLQDTNKQTGSLCFTNHDQLIRLSGEGISPAEYHSSQQERWGTQYVELLRGEVQEIYCTAGNAIMFDKSTLHGATYPRTQPRISVDIRWIHPSPNLDKIELKKGVTSPEFLLKNYVHKLSVDSEGSVFSEQTSKFLRYESLLALYKLDDYLFIRKVEPLLLNKFRLHGVLRNLKSRMRILRSSMN